MKLNKHLKFLTFEVKRSEFTDLQTSSIISHVYFYLSFIHFTFVLCSQFLHVAPQFSLVLFKKL